MTVDHFLKYHSNPNRHDCHPWHKKETTRSSLSLVHPNKPSVRRTMAKWMGYIVKMERQRQSVTQTSIASELGFGMSYISTIEAGFAFKNIRRTIAVINHLSLDPGTCFAAIEAQAIIHHFLLEQFQKMRKQSAIRHYQWSQSKLSYHPIVADKAHDKPDQSRASSRDAL